MADTFQVKVRGAAVAAWWTLLVALVFFAVQWVVYLLVLSARPAFVLTAWGPGATWEGIRESWFLGLAVLKLSLWPLALGALWLTLWARQLRTAVRS